LVADALERLSRLIALQRGQPPDWFPPAAGPAMDKAPGFRQICRAN